MRRQIFRSFTVIALCLAVGYMFWRIYHLPFVELEKEIQAIKAAGEPIHYEEIVPPVPPSSNAVMIYQQAINALPASPEGATEDEQMAFYDFLAGRPADKTKVRRILKRSQHALELAKRATQLPRARWVEMKPFPYEVQLRHCAPLRSLIRLLGAEALLHLQDGNVDRALANCITLLGIVNHLDEEPYTAHVEIVRLIFRTTSRIVERICANGNISPQWVHRLRRLVSGWDGDRALIRCLQLERVLHIQAFDFLRSSPEMAREFSLIWSEGCESFRGNIASFMQPLSRQLAVNELIVLRFDRRLLEIARKGEPYDWSEFAELDKFAQQVKTMGFAFKFPSFLRDFAFRPLAMAGELLSPAGLRFETNLPESAYTFEVIAEAKAYQRLMETALALHLYRHKFGSYPTTLSALVPRFLPDLPKDPFDGKLLRYRCERHRFKVWSVGSNLKDENGTLRGDICLTVRF